MATYLLKWYISRILIYHLSIKITLITKSKFGLKSIDRRYITVRNIENDAGARLISPEKRKCRYTDENFLQVYKHYSYTACTVQCRKDAQIRLCNCTNYFMPGVPEHVKCNVSGIICLSNHVQQLSVRKMSIYFLIITFDIRCICDELVK